MLAAESTALLVSLPSAALAQGQTVCGPEVKAEIVKALSNAVLTRRNLHQLSQVFCGRDRPRVRLRARERSRRRYGETRRSLGEGGQRGVIIKLVT